MKNRLSLTVTIFLGIIIILFNFLYLPSNILSWDVFGYYLWLPELFLYGDLGLKDISVVQHIIDIYHSTATFYQAVQLPSGEWVMRYSMGMALIYSPAFFAGHIIALLFGFTPDGFSAPYQYAILIWGIIFTLTGLFVLRKVLLNYFNDRITTFVLIILIIGTNFFYHNAFYGANAMNHNYLFTLYASLIWSTLKWHETPRFRYAVSIGIIIGIIILSRPPEIACVLIPLLWGIIDKQSIREKLNLISQNKRQVIIAVLIAGLILFMQLIYYKVFTGKFLFYSYSGNAGEGFEFLNPPTLTFLFGFTKGWLIYTPIMIFAISGFYFFYKKNKYAFYASFIYFIVNLYIVSSWSTCWGESLGQKNVIQSYAILALPMGYFLSALTVSKKLVRISVGIVFSFLIFLNLFQTWQILYGVLDPSRMTRSYYFRIFGKTKVSQEDKKLLLVERSYTGTEIFTNQQDYNGRILRNLDFEMDGSDFATKHYITSFAHSGHSSLKMDSTVEFSPNIAAKFKDLTSKDHAWIRASAYIYPVSELKGKPLFLVMTFSHKGANYQYKTLNISDLDLKMNEWNRVTMDYMTPFPRTKRDDLNVYLWNPGKAEVFVDDFMVEVFERNY
ncbi:MAG: hypothetical protein NT175_08075 [Bacteroidetes bacterium]|nr:hypothetical protein [Bacteroidota bacterium]